MDILKLNRRGCTALIGPRRARRSKPLWRVKISPQRLGVLEEACRLRADIPPQEILQTASGWGALELHRRAAQTKASDLTHSAETVITPPQGLVFPAETLGTEQEKWLALLTGGALPDRTPAGLPGEWMVQTEWRGLLEKQLA